MSENLKEFLISLGFRVDERSYEGWRQALAGVDKLALRVGRALRSSDTGVKRMATQITAGFEALNFSSDRLGSSVGALQAYSRALGQIGAGSARPLEAFARQLRLLPSTEGIVNLLGVATRQGGALRDAGDVLMDVIDALDKQDYLRASHNAGLLGITEAEYRKLRGKGDAIRAYIEETKARAKAMGVNPDALGVQSALLMASARGVAADLDLVLSLIAASLAPVMIPLIERIHGWLIGNKDRIVSFLRKMVDAVAAVMVDLGGLLTRLDPVDKAVSDFGRQEGATSSAVKIIGGGFLLIWATRIGRITGLLATGFLALRALFKDGEAQAATVQAGEVVAPSGRRSTFLARVGSLLGFPVEGAEPASKGGVGAGSADSPRPTQKAQTENKEEESVATSGEAPRRGPSTQVSGGNRRVPASIRTNNPGAMWPGPSSAKFGSITHEALNDGLGQGNKIAIFDTPEAGGAALFDLFKARYTGITLQDAIRKWSGGNFSAQYARSVASALGISLSDVVTREMLDDPSFAIPLAKAMSRYEAGREYPMSDEQWRRSHEMFRRGRADPTPATPERRSDAGGIYSNALSSPPLIAGPDELHGDLMQETHITVRGDTNPALTAQAVGRAQAGVNSRMIDRSARVVA